MTAAQQQYNNISAQMSAAGQALASCARANFYSSDYDLIRKHTALDVKELTLEQLTDKSHATQEEIQAILAVHPKAEACRAEYVRSITPVAPSLAALAAQLYNNAERNLIDLIENKKNYGEWATTNKTLVVEYLVSYNKESQIIISGLNQSHQAEMAQRQAAANAFAQYMQTQQLISAIGSRR